MSLFDKISKATEDRNANGFAEMMADDFVFVRHQNGTEMNKAETVAMLDNMFSASSANMGQRRRIYENDDILVEHSINDYPDGTREAVIAVYMLEDGKVTRLETGATLLES